MVALATPLALCCAECAPEIYLGFLAALPTPLSS